MGRTLFGRFLVVLLAFGVMMTAIFALIIQLSHQSYHLELDQRASSALAGQIAAQITEGAGGGGALDAIQSMLGRLAAVNTGVDLYVLDAEGKVLASSLAPARVRRNRVDMAPVRRYLQGDAALPVLGVDPSDPSRDDVFSAASLSGRGSDETYVYALLHRREHQPGAGLIRTSYLLGEGLWIVVAGTLFAIASSLLIVRMLTRRLGRLSSAMEKFRQSGFTEPPELHADPAARPEDEVAQLGRTFAEMAHRIVEQMRDLKRMDSLRRELLADISHDLRTPLTSMQGHLETLTLKEAALSAADKRQYLDIAARQTRRMAKLVSKLFELAKLEAHQVTLEREAFALPDVVQDVVQKFALGASEKGVRLRTDMPEYLPLAYGDIGLIERIFDNLVENALRHTASGGTVGVRLTPAKQRIAVEVSDTGTGIPPEDLPRIFDRFYRGAGERPGSLNSSGLGLAIVKGILELHGTEIQVDSTVGVGTTFRFAIPARASMRDDTGALLRGLTGAIRLRQGKT